MTTDQPNGLYSTLSAPVADAARSDPKDPTTTLTATIETIDNDRPFGASGGRTGMPLP